MLSREASLRFGAEDRPKLIIASLLAVFAVGLMARLITSLVLTPVSVSIEKRSTRNETESRKKQKRNDAFDPTLRSERLRLSEDIRYEGTGQNIFSVEEVSLGITSGLHPSPLPPVPLNNPSPPPVSFRFFGFADIPGDAECVFLLKGSDLFIAREGEIVNRRYRILQITPSSVEVEDLIDGVRQRLLLDQLTTLR